MTQNVHRSRYTKMDLRPKYYFLLVYLLKKCKMQMLRILSVPKNFVLFIRKKMEASLISKEMLPTANKKIGKYSNIYTYPCCKPAA